MKKPKRDFCDSRKAIWTKTPFKSSGKLIWHEKVTEKWSNAIKGYYKIKKKEISRIISL